MCCESDLNLVITMGCLNLFNIQPSDGEMVDRFLSCARIAIPCFAVRENFVLYINLFASCDLHQIVDAFDDDLTNSSRN